MGHAPPSRARLQLHQGLNITSLTRPARPGLGVALEEGIVTHSSILAWEILWTEEPGGLQSLGSQRVGHD